MSTFADAGVIAFGNDGVRGGSCKLYPTPLAFVKDMVAADPDMEWLSITQDDPELEEWRITSLAAMEKQVTTGWVRWCIGRNHVENDSDDRPHWCMSDGPGGGATPAWVYGE